VRGRERKHTCPLEAPLTLLPWRTLLTFERAVLAQAPPRGVLAGASLSPDGKYGAALTVLPTAGGYLMDDVLVRTSAGWENYTGGSGGDKASDAVDLEKRIREGFGES
jgi:hypothetical protein